ncbi:universal stress protein, partial [Mesorhizobium sp.]|uniref:universal stress protein n=1 Tax=Mesorhizobium sp. TaxID=1871066 RepID=UPI0025BBFA68
AALQADQEPAREAPVTRRRHEAPLSAEAVAKEARKGYGVLLIGLGRAVTSKGGFSHRLNDIAGAFDGPLCLVLKPAGAGRQMPRLGPGSGKILVPVNGTSVARRGAELALAIAAVTGAPVKMLYVARVGRDEPRDTVSHRRREAVLKDIVELADRYGVEIETAIRSRAAAADAIARQAGRRVALIVMGVARRPGDELIFGETTSDVLQRCPCPVMLISDARLRRDDEGREAGRSISG